MNNPFNFNRAVFGHLYQNVHIRLNPAPLIGLQNNANQANNNANAFNQPAINQAVNQNLNLNRGQGPANAFNQAVNQNPNLNQGQGPGNPEPNNRLNNEPGHSCLPQANEPTRAQLNEAHAKIDRAMNHIKELFPDLQLRSFLHKERVKRRKCRNMNCMCVNELAIVNVLSDHILSYMHEFERIPRKSFQLTPSRQKLMDSTLYNDTIYEPEAEMPYEVGGKAEDLTKFFNFLASEFINAINASENRMNDHKYAKCECSKWLQKTFINIRCNNLQKLDAVLKQTKAGHNPLAIGIVCFIIENGFIERNEVEPIRAAFVIDKVSINWPDITINPLSKSAIGARQLKFQNYVPFKDLAVKPSQKYDEFIQRLMKKFPDFFDPNGNFNKVILKVRSLNETVFECAVCFEPYLAKYGVECQPTDGNENIDPNMPSSSKDPPKGVTHIFCRPCMRGQAKAATGEMPLAEGGVGLKCMADGCKNAISLYDIRNYIPKEVRARLNERVLEENLGMAQIEHLERCRKCNFAVEMDVPVEVNKVFHCLKCNYQFCRLCDEPWKTHFGYTCAEIKGRDKMRHNLEVKLNEAIFRKCPRCGIQFVKSEACNKMTCRCGQKMCYICRATDIDYNHFCRCPRDPKDQNNLCTCGKSCLLWENPEKKDKAALKEVMRQAPEPIRFKLN